MPGIIFCSHLIYYGQLSIEIQRYCQVVQLLLRYLRNLLFSANSKPQGGEFQNAKSCTCRPLLSEL